MNRYSYEILKWLKSEIYELSSYINGLTCKMRYDYTLPERMQLNEIAKKFSISVLKCRRCFRKTRPPTKRANSKPK